MNLEQELCKMKENIGLSYGVDCTEEENAAYAQILKDGGELPENVFQYKTVSGERLNSFYQLQNDTLSDKKVHEYILLKQYKELKTIRKCIVFLTSLAAMGLIILLLNWLL